MFLRTLSTKGFWYLGLGVAFLLSGCGTTTSEKKEKGNDMIKVLSFFGAPGTGKGTVAQRCVKELGYTMLSTGDLLRKNIQDKTEIGLMLQGYVEKGQLVPDDLITQMVLDWLRMQIYNRKTIILDGFPRTKGQADLFMAALKQHSEFQDFDFSVVNFDLSEQEIIKRISNRVVCSNKACNEVYSLLVKAPKVAGVCDLCGSPLIRRADDDVKVVQDRLTIFNKTQGDLLGFYKESNAKMINFPVPDGSPEVVYQEFIKMVQ